MATVATEGFVEVYVAPGVTSRVLPSLVTPVTENCEVAPTCSVGLVGETVSEVTVFRPTKKPPPHDVSDSATRIATQLPRAFPALGFKRYRIILAIASLF
jgi:hypothetical protein